MIPVLLADATDPTRFGGKAVQLGDAIRAGFTVPAGFACSWELTEAVAARQPEAVTAAEAAYRELGEAVAVRSSAVDEDSGSASFAGQHLTVVNVRTPAEVIDAIAAVHASASTPAALGYRARMGLDAPARMAVVVQRLVNPICAGVLFTLDPFSGEDVRVIEASWGLGEAVVAGLVSPDRFRMARDGTLLGVATGTKDVMLVAAPGGGTAEVPVEPEQVNVPCLSPNDLEALNSLATACERAWPGPHDVEWAIAGEGILLLQRRPVTRKRGAPEFQPAG